jgi:hypothetical protein
MQEKKLGDDHPDLADTLHAYALFLRETKRKSEAKTVDAHARQILARNSSVKHRTKRSKCESWSPRRRPGKKHNSRVRCIANTPS